MTVWVSERSGGIYIALPSAPAVPFKAGDLVEITGVTAAGGYAPVVKASQARVIGKSPLPSTPPKVTFAQILTGAEDGQWVEVEGVVHATLKTLAVRAHQKGLGLTCDIRPEVPDLVVGDLTRLRQILTNLIGNAFKFTEHGEVGLRIAVDSRTPDELRLHFVVADTGVGIAPEKQKVIFDAFSQADGSTARRFG